MNESNDSVVTTIYPVNTRICFRTDEAEELIDLFLKITRKSRTQVVNLKSRIQYFQGKKDKINEVQEKINSEIQKWSEKIVKLGGVPLSLWKIRVPSVEVDDLIWEFPKNYFVNNKSDPKIN